MPSVDFGSFINSLKEYFSKNPAATTFISAHIDPDGDAMASTIGMQAIINHIAPSAKTQIIAWGNNYLGDAHWDKDQLMWVPDVGEYISKQNPDCVIFVDANEVNRFTDKPSTLSSYTGTTFCLDHHPSIKLEMFTHSLITTQASSCAELVGMIMLNLNYQPSKQVATQIMQGIITDTGSLSYTRPYSFSLQVAEWLINTYSLSIESLTNKMYAFQKSTLELLIKILGRTTYVSDTKSKPYMYTYTTLQDLQDYGSETCKLAEDAYKGVYLRKVTGYNWGFIISPDSTNGKEWGISLRSSKDIETNLPIQNVNKIAVLINGGGHDVASGGHIHSNSSIDHLQAMEIVQNIINQVNS